MNKKIALFLMSAGVSYGLGFSPAHAQTNPLPFPHLQRLTQYQPSSSMVQSLPSAAQFRDVAPTDWAYQALDEIIQRYDCLKGYPDGTFRGNRVLSRYEFAAGLNACMQAVERLLADNTSQFVTSADLDTLRRLTEEFAEELQLLTTRVDNLEDKVEFLEANQFSTTTKLRGEVVFALTQSFGEDFVQSSEDLTFLPGVSLDIAGSLDQLASQFGLNSAPRIDAFVENGSELLFGGRSRLDFNTSLTGRDRLLIRLAGTNLFPFTANSEGRFRAPAFPPVLQRPIDGPFTGNTGEAVQTFNLDQFKIGYFFPVGEARIYISPAGGEWHDIAPTLSPAFQDYDGGRGALSTFATESPIYRLGGGAGAAVHIPFNADKIDGVTLGYLAGPGAGSADRGLFNGEYSALGQVTFEFGDMNLGLTYVHGYHRAGNALFDRGVGRNGFVGTNLANYPGSTLQRLMNPLLNLRDAPMVTNSYGFEAAWQLSDTVSINGFFAYTDTILLGQGANEIWTYGLGAAFADVMKPDSLLGVFFGAQPYAGNIDFPGLNYRNNVVPYHAEAFFRYPLSENISLTPGMIWLLGANEFDNDVFIGTVRTTFRF